MDSFGNGPSSDLNKLDLETVSKMPVGGSGNPVADEFRKIGKAAISQLFGQSSQGSFQTQSDTDIAKMKNDDDEFSEREYLELRQKVQAIYDEYRAKKKREEEDKKREEEQKKANQLARLYEMRQGPVGVDVKTAVSKGSAETGKNWGAE